MVQKRRLGNEIAAILSLSLVVTIFTTRLNIQQFYVLPTQCIYVFCVNLRTNRIISLYNINWPVFITQCQFPDCHYAVFSISTNQLSNFRPNTAVYLL